MKCYNCQTELIWGGDHDCEEHEDHNIVSNLSCPECEAFVLVYWDKREGKEDWTEGYKKWSNEKEDEPEMWKHFCEVECSDMMIGKGEACNWCGEEENASSS
tara:strand:- start:151 stop:456 length:306 start_codon:yes stop_codon:yes gene_type:complete